VVAKNVRGHPVALFRSDGREGFDIAGAEALRLYVVAFGTTLQVLEKLVTGDEKCQGPP
jgi:hypothetical protein